LATLSSCSCCDDTLDREASQYKSIYFTKDSYAQAKQAAASLCHLVEEVVRGDRLDNGFACIRPPGHHAEPGMAGGYCILNNVAIAAAYSRDRLGIKRILIVDWDVHHGNGTQNMFLDDPSVVYFSVHRWEGGNFFPFLPTSGPTTVGIGKGIGKTINVGWSRKGMGDNEYYAVWDHVLMPLANEFQPELIIVSAGFDGAEGDMGECYVTPECFGNLMRSLKSLASGNIVAALEGGYVRSVLGRCVEEVVEAMLESNNDADPKHNNKLPFPLELIDSFAAKNIQTTMDVQRKYWKCFQ
jgi:acetoin utilization deacetylase AcuC-like enzyme